MQRIPSIYYGPGDIHGRGVFAGQHLSEGDLVEICPVIVLAPGEGQFLNSSELFNYYFLWGEKRDAYAIALGYGSLYNHAFDANLDFTPRLDDKTISFFCTKEIQAGNELFIDYVSGAKRSDLWFKPSPKQD